MRSKARKYGSVVTCWWLWLLEIGHVKVKVTEPSRMSSTFSRQSYTKYHLLSGAIFVMSVSEMVIFHFVVMKNSFQIKTAWKLWTLYEYRIESPWNESILNCSNHESRISNTFAAALLSWREAIWWTGRRKVARRDAGSDDDDKCGFRSTRQTSCRCDSFVFRRCPARWQH